MFVSTYATPITTEIVKWRQIIGKQLMRNSISRITRGIEWSKAFKIIALVFLAWSTSMGVPVKFGIRMSGSAMQK